MEGNKGFLVDIIDGKKTRFEIPVYQRNYDWKVEQCGRLFDDLVDVVNFQRKEHFFGSIVTQTPRGARIVIDGQQRITTLFLLLAAIRTQLKKNVVQVTSTDKKYQDLADDIQFDYLVDERRRSEYKLRLKLVKSDSKAFEAIVDEKEENYILTSNVTQNYLYFLDRIARMNIKVEELYEAIQLLCVVDIKLEDSDDAQLIFESLNSTGLDLTEADKIRNFILMNLDPEKQEQCYIDLWNPIEKNTDYDVSDFIRFYLAAKTGKTPAVKKVYQSFRQYSDSLLRMNGSYKDGQLQDLLEDLLKYSRYYHYCVHADTKTQAINDALYAISLFDATVTRPYLMNLLDYHAQQKISDSSVAESLWVIDSFLFRRWTCALPTNALNKIFEALHTDVLKYINQSDDYTTILKHVLLSKKSTSRFPLDDEFIRNVNSRNFYKIGNRKYYVFDKLENGNSFERINVVEGLQDGTFTVEHVMPQTLNDEWKQSLGVNWESIHSDWCHNIANLTISAYNSDYSNRSFANKRDMPNGFKSSGFRMNNWIAQQEIWGEAQLEERQRMLDELFIQLWPLPQSNFVPSQVLPDVVSLDSNFTFTNRRITSFTYRNVKYPANQWNEMELKVLKLVYETEPAKIHSLVEGTFDIAKKFSNHDQRGFAKLVNDIYVRTNSSTQDKIDLLLGVFALCGIDADELYIEMAVVDPDR